MIKATVTSAPPGIPFEHVEGCAVPRAMFTSVMMLFTATVPVPPQSPTHCAVAPPLDTETISDASENRTPGKYRARFLPSIRWAFRSLLRGRHPIQAHL